MSWALQPFLDRTDVVDVVIAVDPTARVALTGSESGQIQDPRIRTTVGGSTRFESVANALATLRDDASIVAVHDGARPFPPPEAIAECIRLAKNGLGAVAGIPATDTVKDATDDGVILRTPDREGLWYAQTPQVFPRKMLDRAVAYCKDAALSPTDDASAVEFAGGEIHMVMASARNLKVTYPADLVIARAFVAEGLV